MGEYETISVPSKVKEALEKEKEDRKWGEFLLGLYREVERMRSERAFEELVGELSEEELEEVRESSREFRKGFELE